MFVTKLALATPLLAGLAAAECYAGVNIFQARGTGESTMGSLSDVPVNATLAAIPNSHLTRVDYPANFSWPVSPNIGTQHMSALVNNYHDACPDNKIVLLGYSQGALVLGNVLTGGVEGTPALSESVKKQVVGVIQYGDLGRQANQSYDRGSCINNAGTVRQGDQATIFNSYGSHMLSYCNMADPVCCLNGTSAAAHVGYFSQEDGQEVADFLKKQYDAAGGASTSPSAGASSSVSSSATPSASSTGAATPATSTSAAATNAATPAASTAPAATPSARTGAAQRIAVASLGWALPAVLFAAFLF